MPEEIKTPRLLNEINVVLKGEKNYNLTTNYRGRITADLTPGNYDLFLEMDNDSRTAPFSVNCKK